MIPESSGNLDNQPMRDALDHLPALAFLEREGRLIHANRAACRLLGLAEGEPIDLPLSAVLRPAPPDKNIVPIDAGLSTSFRGTLLCANRKRIAATITPTPSNNASPCRILIAVPTPPVAAEPKSIVEDALFSMTEAILITRETRVLYVNPAFTRLFGYTLEDIFDREITGLSSLETQTNEFDLIRQIVQTRGRAAIETVRQTRDGELVDVHVSCAPLISDGSFAGYILSYRDIRDQKQNRARLQHFALHDALTGLPNRALFLDRLKLAMARHNRRRDMSFGVLFVDLDKFKEINDARGHAAGDALLVEVASRLSTAIRPQDTAARLSGDEFALLLDQVQTVADMSVVATRVLTEMQRPFEILGSSLHIGASIGIALCSGEHQVPEQLVRDADFAMYRAKQNGGHRFEVFDRYMQVHISSQQEKERNLRQVLDRREFAVFYQPFYRLQNGQLEGFESLLRWRRKDGSFESFQDLLSTAESAGLSITLNRETMLEACGQMRSWAKAWPESSFALSMNLSSRQFFHPEFLGLVDYVLEKSETDPSRMMFEIPETVLNEAPEVAEKILQSLAERHIRIAVDNFGAGMASVNHLVHMPLDLMKLDPRLTATAAGGGRQSALLASLIQLGQSLGIEVMAQRVELPYQHEILRQMGCDLVQGFLFAPAVSADATGAMISHGRWPDPISEQPSSNLKDHPNLHGSTPRKSVLRLD